LQLLQILIFTAHYYAETKIPRCQPQHEASSDSYRDCFHELAKVDLAMVDSLLTNYENFYTLDAKTSESKVVRECAVLPLHIKCQIPKQCGKFIVLVTLLGSTEWGECGKNRMCVFH